MNEERVFKLNNKPIKDGDVVYLMTRDFRLEDNWGLLYAQEIADTREVKVFYLDNPEAYSKIQESFFKKGVLTFEKWRNQKAGAIVVDFNPLLKPIEADCAVFEVDSHNIVPARFVSGKQEYSAATLRRKIHSNLDYFLTEFPTAFPTASTSRTTPAPTSPSMSASSPTPTPPPMSPPPKYDVLDDFINERLDLYNEYKNNPTYDATSNLSPYIHFGFISSQRIALEVLKSKASDENKQSFLEELIVRKELADNFCLYNKAYKSLKGCPNWAQETLKIHSNDIRSYVYDLEIFENAQTHDELWNAAQRQLLYSNKIHGYMRMYWAKKILEWSKSPQEAIDIAIYLNDKYSIDGNDPNGYVGILWSIGGLHDRAFANRSVTGKIRYMSYQGCKRKFDIKKYIDISGNDKIRE